MTDSFVHSPNETADNLLQLFAAILLGLAATLTAVSSYEAALLDGAALQGFSNSTRTLSDANAFYDQGNQEVAKDQQMFIAYATATHEGNDDLARYLTTLMSPELKEAIAWWKKSGDKRSPIDLDVKESPYALEDFGEANDLEDEASALYKKALRATNKGDKFQLSTVLFALTLFFGGISTVFRRESVARALLGMSAITLVVGAAQLGLAILA